MDILQTFLIRFSTAFESFSIVALRLPGLLIFDLWFRLNLGESFNRQEGSSRLSDQVTHFSENLSFLPLFTFDQPDYFAVQVLGYAALMFGAGLLVLPFPKLVAVYLHICSLLLLACSHYLSNRYVQAEVEVGGEVVLDELSKLERHGFHLLAQVCLAVVISCLLGLRTAFARTSLTVYVAPIIARMCGIPPVKLHVVHNFSCSFMMLIIAFYILNLVPTILSFLKKAGSYLKLLFQANGLIGAAYELCAQLMFLPQLASFWLVLVITQLCIRKHALATKEWYLSVLIILSESCSTPASLIGFCVSIAYMSRFILLFTKLYLQGIDGFLNNENVLHNGYAEGLTVLMLAAQSGLLEMSSGQRALLTAVILTIVMSSVLQLIYEITDPILLSLGASHNSNVFKHIRVLLFCVGLVVFPILMSFAISHFLPTDFWLLVIISSCVLTSLQTLTSLVIYGLFLYDAAQSESWEKLDDMIFCCRSLTRILEFIVAIIVICYGVYESIFGEWSWANSSLLILHCYFNVFQRLQVGWRSFLLRRQAFRMINVFPLATREQLEQLQDVCSICFQDMNFARVLPCGHMFHGACLRKWLYVKQTCPLCHKDVNWKPSDEPSHDTSVVSPMVAEIDDSVALLHESDMEAVAAVDSEDLLSLVRIAQESSSSSDEASPMKLEYEASTMKPAASNVELRHRRTVGCTSNDCGANSGFTL